ncbi:MAG: aminotransferase class I/II-fold pyridoxal phosphate-dependent enzyme [Planctomycetia bacterium]|nr:aminotransferase class I/II-fold pyridoxal phosphate-dependent enzyme [Planctomycetia bacterium]
MEDRIYLSPPHMSSRERELLLDAFDSNWIAPLGPHVDALEREFAREIGVEHAVAMATGTAALHLALLLSGVGPGDEVLTSTLTFAATANAVTYVGARPVFVDSERDTWNMNPGLLAEELAACARRGRLPKAAVVVDIYGQCADYEPILDACRAYGVTVIEDAAESLGATYRGRAAGTFGRFGCFSFNGNKIITASGGGILVASEKDLADRARFLATQARDPAPHYQHSEIGYNYRMSNLLAAIARGQLGVLRDRVARRRANYDFYRRELGDMPGVDFMPEHPASIATRWLTCLTIDPARFGSTREDVRLELERHNIESRPVWKPMHLQPVFARCRARDGAVATDLFERGLCLPSGSNLSERDLGRVVETIRSVGARRGRPAALQPRTEPRPSGNGQSSRRSQEAA